MFIDTTKPSLLSGRFIIQVLDDDGNYDEAATTQQSEELLASLSKEPKLMAEESAEAEAASEPSA